MAGIMDDGFPAAHVASGDPTFQADHRKMLKQVLKRLSGWQAEHEHVPFIFDNAYGIKALLEDVRKDIFQHLKDTEDTK